MKIVKFTDMTIVKKEGENRQIDFVLTDLIISQNFETKYPPLHPGFK